MAFEVRSIFFLNTTEAYGLRGVECSLLDMIEAYSLRGAKFWAEAHGLYDRV